MKKEMVLQLRLTRGPVLVAALAVTVVLGVVFVGTVSAQSDDQTINGCYNNKTRILKIIDNPGECKKKKQTPISFNQTGPPGSAGPQGATGSQGEPGPQGQQGPQGPAGQPPSIQFAEVDGTVSPISNEAYENLGGPEVTVNVPASGFVEVYAQVTVKSDIDEGAVALYDGSTPVDGQATSCGPSGERGGILDVEPSLFPSEIVTVGTGSNLGLGITCGIEGAPSPLLFQLSPGPHTLSLYYAECSCGGSQDPEVQFSNRKLWVTPRP